MGLENPQSYGEFYWGASVAARLKALEDEGEQTKQYIPNIFTDEDMRKAVPFDFMQKWDSLIEHPAAALGGVGMRFISEMADSILGKTMNHALKDFNYVVAAKFHDEHIAPPEAAKLYLRGWVDEELFYMRLLQMGYARSEADMLVGSQIEYPSITDLMRWGRYHGDPENVKEVVWEKFHLPVTDHDFYEWFSLQVPPTDMITKLFRRGVIEQSDFANMIKQVGWRGMDIDYCMESSWLIPNAMLLVQAGLHNGLGDEDILQDISKADIHPEYAQKYLDAIMTKPAPADLIRYELRHDPELSDLPAKLRRLGIHDEYTDVYKTLAYEIPPIADIITMAVREAFSPAIASRFGQYEDYPDELTEWAQKKGMTKEWAQRYWAAHWSLPSPQQGFEMLHRGIIDTAELNMLLRALDVMPFWRDKLTAMAYRPLTRVDVRRMYREGVLDERGVYEAYLDNGYAPDNAEKMTEFTVKYVLSQQAKFTSTDVVAAYTKRMIQSSEARSLLSDLGISGNNISYIISTADYKRKWALTDAKIKGIRNLYKRYVYDENKTRGELLKLNLPAQQVDVLMEQWWYEDKTEPTANYTLAQTLKFTKAGFITESRARQELRELGYDDEHVSVYMRSIQ